MINPLQPSVALLDPLKTYRFSDVLGGIEKQHGAVMG